MKKGERKEITPEEALALVMKQREYMREYMREYRKAHQDKVAAAQRAYYEANKDRLNRAKVEYHRKIREGYKAAKKAGLI